MYEIFRASKPYLEAIAASFDLTPQQVFALKNLDSQESMTMSELATLLGCDASNVTAIVDKLESRGFVERRSADRDRRVKALIVTPAGRDLRSRIEERFEQPPPALASLSLADQKTLVQIFQRALTSP